jgi:uncharacterized protein YdhG (YjbR/CyaY superfamily)
MSMVLDTNAKVPLNLISRTPFHNIVTIKLIPLDLKGNPSKPPKGVTIAFVQLIIPNSKPFRKPLNYDEYKKNSNLDVHVQVFKVAIKVNDEMVDDKIINQFNFTLKNKAFDQCNNYMRYHVQAFVDTIELCKMMNMCI